MVRRLSQTAGVGSRGGKGQRGWRKYADQHEYDDGSRYQPLHDSGAGPTPAKTKSDLESIGYRQKERNRPL
jgi:hypothetical protein